MNAAPGPHANPPSHPIPATVYALRWEGAMNDGNGTSGSQGAAAVLCANADEIWLSGRRGDFHLPRAAVVRVGRAGMYPWFFRGIRIRHTVAGYPPILQFGAWTVPSRQVISQLRSLGFP